MAAHIRLTKVVSIGDFRPAATSRISGISQERLIAGWKLLEEQRRVAEAVQNFKLDLDRELSAGAEIEAGELTFDRELKIVRRKGVTRRQASIR